MLDDKDTSGLEAGSRSGKRMRHGKQDFPVCWISRFWDETAESGQDGRNYTEYLSCMMFFMDRGVRNFRMMDLIQWNIRMGQADFSVASCAYQIEIEAEVMQKHMFFQKEEYRGTVHAAGSY